METKFTKSKLAAAIGSATLAMALSGPTTSRRAGWPYWVDMSGLLAMWLDSSCVKGRAMRMRT